MRVVAVNTVPFPLCLLPKRVAQPRIGGLGRQAPWSFDGRGFRIVPDGRSLRCHRLNGNPCGEESPSNCNRETATLEINLLHRPILPSARPDWQR